MSNMSKKLSVCLLILVFTVLLFAFTTSTAARTLKLAHVTGVEYIYHIAAQEIGAMLEELTNGELSIEIYPGGQLGGERDIIESLQMGTLDMAFVAVAPLSSFSSVLLGIDMPFLFENADETISVLVGTPLGKTLLDSLEEVKLKGMALWVIGMRSVLNKVRPINTPSDLAGLKIRLMENPVHLDTFRALGASVTPIPFTEVYLAVQTGVAHGAENDAQTLHTISLEEVAKYYSLTSHFANNVVLIMSLDTWNSLTLNQKYIFEYIIDKYTPTFLQKAKEGNEKYMQVFIDTGVQVNIPQLELFREATKPVLEKFKEQYPEILWVVNEVNKLAAQLRD